MRRYVLPALGIALLSACSRSTADTIRIGFIGPLTGDAVSYGVDALRATQLAVEEQNALGGIHGKMIELIAEDGACSGSAAADAAHKLIEVDHVAAILGGNCSNETLAAAPIAEAHHTILLAAVSSSKDVTAAGDYVFRIWPSNAKAAPKAYAKFLGNHGYKSLAMFSEETVYCKSLQNAVKANLPVGVTAVVDELIPAGTKDFRSILTRLKDADFDLLYVNLQGDGSIAQFLTQFRELGFTQDILTNDIGESATLATLIPDAIEGTYVLSIASPEGTTEMGKQFVETFEKRFGKPKQAPSFPAAAYDAARILFRAMEQSTVIDGPSLRDALYATKDFPATIGSISFDTNGDAYGIPYGMKQWQKGNVVQQETVPLE